MPKPNSTEMTANLNQQEAMLENSSNTNLNSRVVEAQTTKSKGKLYVDDECDVIGDLIGHYGKWQCMMTLLLSLFQVPNTFHIFSPTFQVSWFSLAAVWINVVEFLRISGRKSSLPTFFLKTFYKVHSKLLLGKRIRT